MKTNTAKELLEELRAHPEAITAETIDQLTAETKAAAEASQEAEAAYFKDAAERTASIQDRIAAARGKASEIDGQIAELNQRIKDAAVGGSAEDLDRLTGQIDELATEKEKALKAAERFGEINPGGSSELYQAVIKAVGIFASAKKESDAALYQLAEIAEAKAEELEKVARAARNGVSMNYHAADQMKVSNHYHAELRQQAREAAAAEKPQPSRMTTTLTPPDRPQQRNAEGAVCTNRETTVFGSRQGESEQRVSVINPWDHVKKAGDENDY